MGDGTADGTGESESGVESETAQLLRLSGLDGLLCVVELREAGGGWGRSSGSRHCGGWYGRQRRGRLSGDWIEVMERVEREGEEVELS